DSLEGFSGTSWTLLISRTAVDVYSGARALTTNLVGTLILLFLITVGGIALVGQSLIRPLVQAIQVAGRIAAGDFKVKVPAGSNDEIGALASALNAMSTRLSTLVGSLETGVVERTRNIEIAAEISRDAARLRDIDALLQRAVNAIRERFNFY